LLKLKLKVRLVVIKAIIIATLKAITLVMVELAPEPELLVLLLA
jgi:hypothetical protein